MFAPRSCKVIWICIDQVESRTYVNRTDEVFGSHKQIRVDDPEENREGPCADEPLDRLLWADLDKLRPAKRNPADIGPDIICDDECARKDQPDHALEDVVHDKVRLNDDQI